MSVEWKEPGLRKIEKIGREPVWYPLCAELCQRPEKWALLRTMKDAKSGDNALANLRRGNYRLPAGRFEFVKRGAEVYGRYLGAEGEESNGKS